MRNILESHHQEIAAIIVKLALDSEQLARQRAAAWLTRETAGYDHAIRKIGAIIGAIS